MVIHCINNFLKKILSVVTGKFTMPYVKYIANGNVLYDPGNPNGLCETLEGGAGWEIGGRCGREGTWV